jgi:hypothetical protein
MASSFGWQDPEGRGGNGIEPPIGLVRRFLWIRYNENPLLRKYSFILESKISAYF